MHSTTIAVRKLPRQVDSLKLDSPAVVLLGKQVSGGTRPRASRGRTSLLDQPGLGDRKR